MYLPDFPRLDLFAAGINALNGILVARSASHDRNFTLVGLLTMAFIGGIGGGISRDVLLNEIPGPLKEVSFLIVCLTMGFLGLAIDEYSMRRGERFRRRTLSVIKSGTLPWFAILGAHKALEHDLGILAAIIVGVIATTAGSVIIDLISGVTPEIVKQAEHLVTTAIIAAGVYSVLAIEASRDLVQVHITLIAFAASFIFRLIAVGKRWEEIVPGGRQRGPRPPRQSASAG